MPCTKTTMQFSLMWVSTYRPIATAEDTGVLVAMYLCMYFFSLGCPDVKGIRQLCWKVRMYCIIDMHTYVSITLSIQRYLSVAQLLLHYLPCEKAEWGRTLSSKRYGACTYLYITSREARLWWASLLRCSFDSGPSTALRRLIQRQSLDDTTVVS